MTVSLVHYLYFFQNDHKNINRIYEYFGINEDTYQDLLQECTPREDFGERGRVYPIHSFQREEINVCLHLFQDIYILSFYISCNLEGTVSEGFLCNQYQHWRKIRKEMKINELNLLGETTLLLAPSEIFDENLLLKQSRELSLSSTVFKTCTHYGKLVHFFDLEDEDHHIYALFPKDNLKPDLKSTIDTFLEECLPFLDLTLFKLEKKSKYYSEQIRDILKAKEEIDDEISNILHFHLEVKREMKGVESDRTDILDRTMENVSDIYSSLVLNARVIKRAHSDLNNELNLLMEAVERITLAGDEKNTFFTKYQRRYQSKLRDFASAFEDVNDTLENIKTTIEVIQARIELVRNKESVIIQKQIKNLLDQNVVLQEEGRTIEIAAGLIEFIIVMYYTLNIWKTLTPPLIFEKIPASLKFALLLLFAGDVVLATRLAVDFIKRKRGIEGKFILSLLGICLLVFLMIWLSSGKLLI